MYAQSQPRKPDILQPIMVQFPSSNTISVRLSHTPHSSDKQKSFCLHCWVRAASLPPKEKKKKNYMTQGQRKGQDRLWLTFPTQVTICFRGILLCDSQSIKQHIPTHSATFLHPQGHSYPWVIISVADKQPHMSYCPPFSVRRSHRIFYLKLQCVGTGIPPWGIIRICQETKAVT